MHLKLTGDWAKSKRVLKAAPAELDAAIDAALTAEGEYLRGRMVKKIQGGLQPPHSSSTLLTKKGGTKPLIRRGDLLGAFQVVQAKKEVFIGVPRTAKGGAANLMQIHEFGKVIVQRITDKQRRFLHAVLPKKEGAGTAVVVIHIPARPVIRPVFEAERANIPKRLSRRILKGLSFVRGT